MTTSDRAGFSLPPYEPPPRKMSDAYWSSLAGSVERGERVVLTHHARVCSILARVGEDAYPVRVDRKGSRFIIKKEEEDNGNRE